MPHLKSLTMTSEDVFREVACLLDFLLYHEKEITQRAVNNLWDALVNDIREWKPDAQDKDKMLVAGTVFCIVRDVLGHHWKQRFCEEIYAMLTETLDKNFKLSKEDEDEQKKFLERLTECSEALSEWINVYEDGEGEWLSDEIAACLLKRKPDKPAAPKKTKEDYSKYSFELKPKGRFKNKVELCLKWLHTELIFKKFIMDYELPEESELSHFYNLEESNKLVFNTVFSGADTDDHIVWIEDKVQLRYFITQLEKRKALSWKTGPGKWQVTRNRIWYRKETGYKVSETTGEKYPQYEIVQFGEHDLDKGNKPKDTSKMDSILEMIAPPIEKKTLGDEIADDFRKHANYEATHENSGERILSNSFRETSHKARK